MSQLGVSNYDSCFRSFDTLSNCYPTMTAPLRAFKYYGCQGLRINTFWWEHLHNHIEFFADPKNYIRLRAAYIVIFKSLENIVCHKESLFSSVNIGSIAYLLFQNAMTHIHLGMLSIANLKLGSDMPMESFRQQFGDDAEKTFESTKQAVTTITKPLFSTALSAYRVLAWDASKWEKFCNSYKKETLLHEAAFLERTELLEHLVERGYYINLRDKIGNTALHYAAQKGTIKAALYLEAKGIDVKVKNNKGDDFFDCAIRHSQIEFVKEIYLAGTWLPVEAILEKALKYQSLPLITYFAPKVDLNWVSNKGQTFQDLAKETQSQDIIKIFNIPSQVIEVNNTLVPRKEEL